MSAYTDKYENILRGVLTEWIGQAENAEEKQYAEVRKVLDDPIGRGFGHEGPLSYLLGWHMDDIVGAEFEARLARTIRGEMDEEGEGRKPSEVYARAMKLLDEAVAKGLNAASTSTASNAVELLIGRYALKLREGSWSGFGGLADRAEWETKRQIIAEAKTDSGVALPDLESQARARVREVEGQLARARSEASRAKLEEALMFAKADLERIMRREDEVVEEAKQEA